MENKVSKVEEVFGIVGEKFLNSVVYTFAMPSESRLTDNDPCWIYDTIDSTAQTCLRFPLIVGGLFSPVLASTLILGNIFSGVYELAAHKKRESKKRSLLTRIKSFAATYALCGILSLGHYNLTRDRSQNLKLNNVEISQVVLKKGGLETRFDLVREIHEYNQASHNFISLYLDNRKPDLLVSEGVMVNSRSEIPISEKLVVQAIRPFCAGAGYNYPDLVDTAESKSVPVEFLEKYSNGKREGLSTQENIALGIAGVGGIAVAPQLYFAGLPLRYLPCKSIVHMPKDLSIISSRNEIIADRVLEVLERNSDKRIAVNVGRDHGDGLIRCFEKRGYKVEAHQLNQ